MSRDGPPVVAAGLLFVFLSLIVYASLYPFRFESPTHSIPESIAMLSWARASRLDMFNNVLLYMPLGFCTALILQPRLSRVATLAGTAIAGGLLSLGVELTQASVVGRVPSLTDLSLNTAGALIGAIAGSIWFAMGVRITPGISSRYRSSSVALIILLLWVLARLWPMMPILSIRQLKLAVQPLFYPRIELMDLAAFFIGWLVVAQAVFHLSRPQRAVDTFLVVIAAVLVGRILTAGNTLVLAELASLALLLPALVPLTRLEHGTRSTLIAAALGTWLAWVAMTPFTGDTAAAAETGGIALSQFTVHQPVPAQFATRAFSYTAFAWLLAGAGLFPHVAAALMILFVILLCLMQAGIDTPAFGWTDILIALLGGAMVARWMPRGVQTTRPG
jgi:glycopeptide antibiotics resistance protein